VVKKYVSSLSGLGVHATFGGDVHQQVSKKEKIDNGEKLAFQPLTREDKIHGLCFTVWGF